MTNQLSPAAQAVLDAAENAYGYNYSDFHCCADRVAAAALRAAADQVEPDDGVPSEVRRVLDKLLAIATELEAQ